MTNHAVQAPSRTAVAALRVLIVDDNPADCELLERLLRKCCGAATHIEGAATARAALQQLQSGAFDLVLLDYRLPDMHGLDLLSAISEMRSSAAVILLTGQGTETIAAQAIKRGAADYLVKRDLSARTLEASVRQTLEPRAASGVVRRIDPGPGELDRIVRTLSHDMTANFMVLESSFRQLKQSCGPAPLPALSDGVSHVEACLKQSKRFLDDLRTLSKTGSIAMEPSRVELGAVVEEVLFELRPAIAAHGATVSVQHDLPVVWCHAARARQVFANLVQNALKHGCDPREPRIAIGSPGYGPVPLPAGHVWIKVHDNGPGVPGAHREEIFSPGRRLNPSAAGSGLGLAIVRQIVGHYGGCVLVDPASSVGAAFLFSLPAAV